ncbi:MAG TPA: sugar ABC transporter ATP-binding protein [Verrucomicrobiae bacterium]|nr:sugar ABC transporter ATP-binding protein [Verrucomicrobiae bacterium]
MIALDNVSLRVDRGEVLALVGENGAGKSTLMKILGGVHQPDAGEILFDGQPVRIRHVSDALRLGIAFIHQELNVLDNLDVAANVFLGREPRSSAFGLIDTRRIHAETKPFLDRLGLTVPTRTRVGQLSIAQRQLVEIARALSLQARLLIMDEPTSSLTLPETQRLLALVRELRSQGVSVIYISHRLGELDQCADRVAVLRDGRNAGELARDEIHHDRMVGMMVGREIKNFYVTSSAPRTPRHLRVRGLRSRLFPQHAVSFDAAQGEILGFAGLVGAGRSELMKALVGLDGPVTADVFLGDKKLAINSPRDAIGHGLYLAPEDRASEGLVLRMTIRENITLPCLPHYAAAGLIQRKRERAVAEEQMSSLKIKAPTAESLLLNLSGGNQQKVVLGKWLAMRPAVMILDEPTRGIDVGAKAEIYRLMRALAQGGAVILMVSSDMEEVLNLSDRVAVMHEGKITGLLERAHCAEDKIMQLAMGRPSGCAQPAFTEP